MRSYCTILHRHPIRAWSPLLHTSLVVRLLGGRAPPPPQALVKSVKDSDLPVSSSVLWNQHMLPVRPVGSVLDVKKSKHKKLSKFLLAFAKSTPNFLSVGWIVWGCMGEEPCHGPVGQPDAAAALRSRSACVN